MNKHILSVIATAIVATATVSGCSMSAEPEPTIAPVEKPAQVINVLDEYAVLAGHTLFTSQNGDFSIQIPEGSKIDSTDPENITITIESEFEKADFINIARSDDATIVDSEAKLMDMLKNDDSIDVTGFFLLKNNGAYEGYKYSYTAVADPQLKGIKSTYFSTDGTAYIVTATINNGGDEINMTNINTIVDTFINYK